MRITLAVAVACLTLGGLAAAGDATAAIRRETYIPAEGLGTALTKLAKQFDFQVLYRTEIVSDLKSPGATGALTSDEALGKVLTGTGLTYKYLDDKTVTIIPVSVTDSGRSTAANASGSPDNASTSKEAGKTTSQGFRVAQVDQGKGSNVSSVEDQAANPHENSNGASTGLSEIVVTARRREETLDKVPISITAFSQRTMDDLHIQSVGDLAAIVPGLVLTPPSPGAAQDYGDIAIRGIYSSANGGFVGNAPTTQLYIDETPIAIRQLAASTSKSPWPNIFDLDRVEVLRGPQGTLFGASAMGGAIRFITPQPNLNEASGFAKGDVGYTKGGEPSYEVGAEYGAPIISGTAGFRVSAWFQSSSGFVDREDPYSGDILGKNADRSNAYVVRPAFTFAPSDQLSITAALFLQHQHSDNPDSIWLDDLPNTDRRNYASGFISQPMADNLRVSSLSVKYDFSGISFISDTSYLDRTSSAINDITQLIEAAFTGGSAVLPGLSGFAVYDDNISYTHAWQQEFRLSSQDPSSRVNWVAGAFYRHSVQGLEQLQPPDLTPVLQVAFNDPNITSEEVFGPNYVHNGQVLNSYDNFHATDISEAVFGDVTVSLLPQLKLDIGLRYEHQIVEGQDQISAGPLGGGSYKDIVAQDQVANPVTPRASLAYQFTDSAMVYASAAKGYRPGGGNSVGLINGNPNCEESLKSLGLTGAPATFGPDSLWSYEFGTKNFLFNKRVSIEGSVYYIKWNNIQSAVSVPSCQSQFTTNEGEAISRGFDLQMAASITHNLILRASLGYTDVYYPNAAYGAPVNGVPPLLNGAGDKLKNVIPWTASANAQYTHDVSSLWNSSQGYVRLDYRWLDAVVPLNPNVSGFDPEVGFNRNPAYSVLNLRLGIIHGGLDISAYVNNATNSGPVLGYANPGTNSDLFYANTIRPITFGITSWYRF